MVGDGVSSVKKLLLLKQKEFIINDRDTVINLKDFRIKAILERNKMSFKTVFKKGEKFNLLDNANLSTGGDAYDMTGKIHPSFKKFAVDVTRDMGLRLCGVDVLVQGDITKKISKNNNCKIIEINSAPGLDNYYTVGEKQKKIVEKLYLDLLKAMSK